MADNEYRPKEDYSREEEAPKQEKKPKKEKLCYIKILEISLLIEYQK